MCIGHFNHMDMDFDTSCLYNGSSLDVTKMQKIETGHWEMRTKLHIEIPKAIKNLKDILPYVTEFELQYSEFEVWLDTVEEYLFTYEMESSQSRSEERLKSCKVSIGIIVLRSNRNVTTYNDMSSHLSSSK